MLKGKKAHYYIVTFFMTSTILLLTIACGIIVVDPWLHYRNPREWFEYDLGEEDTVYFAPGLVTNLEYNVLITGSSQSMNFSCQEASELFEGKTIRVTQSGASMKEIARVVNKALSANENLKVVIIPIDAVNIIQDKDFCRIPESEKIEYLYDDNLFNDVSYIWNMESLVRLVLQLKDTLVERKIDSTYSFDRFKMQQSEFEWNHSIELEPMKEYTQEDQIMVQDNVEQNILSIAREYPNTDFYYFFTPYSIAHIDGYDRRGELNRLLNAQVCALKMLAGYDNIHIYSFWNVEGLSEDFSLYSNAGHYNERVCTDILEWIYSGTYELTENDIEEYTDLLWNNYMYYDYDNKYEQYYNGTDD